MNESIGWLEAHESTLGGSREASTLFRPRRALINAPYARRGGCERTMSCAMHLAGAAMLQVVRGLAVPTLVCGGRK